MNKIIIGLTLLIGALTGFIASTPQGPTFGSIATGDEYYSTSTKNFVGTTLADRTLKMGPGALAQVTITGAAAGQVTLCDATTTNISLRAPTMATSSLNCWNIPASTAAGTYVFDATFNYGLVLDSDATAPTSTVMWR